MAIEEPKYKCPMQSAFFTLKLAAATKSKKLNRRRRVCGQNKFYTNFPPMKVFPFHYFSARVYRNCSAMFRFSFLVKNSFFPPPIPRCPLAVWMGVWCGWCPDQFKIKLKNCS